MSVDHLAVLRTEGARLASMPPEALAAPVPTVPGWTLEHVVRHTGKVHRWAAAVILAGAGADTGAVAKQQVESLPKGPDCLPAYRDSLDAVIATFESVAPDSAVETFVGTRTASWWLRRQGHEVAVHRIDAADAVRAAGGAAPAALDPAAAADAVAELTEVQYPHRLLLDRLTPGSIGRTVHVHGTDVDDLEWMFTLGSSGLTSTRGHGRADVALRGSAEHLLLVLWRRRPLDVLTVFGDTSVAASLIDASRF